MKFTALSLPVVAHAQWDDQQTRGTLRIVSDVNDAIAVSAKLPPKESEEFDKLRYALKHSDERGIIEVDGDVALTLTNFLTTYHDSVAQYTHVAHEPELLGTWGPPEKRGLGKGIYMWFHPDEGYHVKVVNSKEQAEALLDDLTWLDEERRENLLRQVRSWNAIKRSAEKPLHIEGARAELLCKASVIAKMWASRRAMAQS